jgi:hypothetical protein
MAQEFRATTFVSLLYYHFRPLFHQSPANSPHLVLCADSVCKRYHEVCIGRLSLARTVVCLPWLATGSSTNGSSVFS